MYENTLCISASIYVSSSFFIFFSVYVFVCFVLFLFASTVSSFVIFLIVCLCSEQTGWIFMYGEVGWIWEELEGRILQSEYIVWEKKIFLIKKKLKDSFVSKTLKQREAKIHHSTALLWIACISTYTILLLWIITCVISVQQCLKI